MLNVKVVSSVQTITDHPFRCIFNLEANGEVFKGALVGHLGKEMANALREGDDLFVEGHWIAEKKFGDVLIIEHAVLPEEARQGRSVNYYA